MKYTEEIFNILSKGGFISANSVSPAIKRYYDAIEEDLTDYYEYYKGIGFYLEGGDGYYMFTRQEAKVDLERKLEAVMKWIDYLSFLKTYDATFGPGFIIRKSNFSPNPKRSVPNLGFRLKRSVQKSTNAQQEKKPKEYLLLRLLFV